jgi:hypothetical protein
MTLCEPGVSVPEIFGFASVARAAGAVAAGFCTSVLGVCRVGVLVAVGVLVVRGRLDGAEGAEELLFWACTAGMAKVKTKMKMIAKRLFINTPVIDLICRALTSSEVSN